MNLEKLSKICLLFCLLAGLPTNAMAQLQNCGLTPGSIGIVGGALQPNEANPDPMYTGGPDSLSLNQYVFSYPDSLVTDTFTNTSGPLLFFANDSGSIIPSDFGMVHGDEFCVQFLHFKLDALQEQLDSLFLGSTLGIACCDFAELIQGVDVCHIMDSLGITTGADIMDGNGLIDFAAAYGVAPSLEAVSFLIDSVINILPGGGCVASNLPMCYALSAPVCFTIDSTAGISAIGNPALNGGVESLAISPNPAANFANISLTASQELEGGLTNLRLSTIDGKLIWERKQFIQPGKNEFNLDISPLASGVYLLSLEGTNFVHRGKLLVE